MNGPVRLLIVDDHPVVRDGLRGMFTGDPGFEVLGEAADGAEALVLAASLRPDVVLMDLRMPGMDGVTAIGRLAASGSPVKVLVQTHLLHVYAKLGVNDRAAAVAAAYDRGLLTPGGR
ncbi:response regulator transcription factor [Micromonospora craniellae]|uniref:DNA-binding response regulator n=1 Tax=Micromonospora craniellae TaxID=2294034 RepID=A0A372FXP6_9ACTN|nr:response regulator transcription factor [Micromonospora craniellae]QOC90110.1 response regulator transcription factor [Micromonospora craniellae]RFS45306.1 DNA-binding response regulator [Micromonospora craniellae]